MAKFQTVAEAAEEVYSIGMNLVLTGSKKMDRSEVEKLLSTSTVRVTIRDAEKNSVVLVDQEVSASEFSTGNVGFKLHTKGLRFHGG